MKNKPYQGALVGGVVLLIIALLITFISLQKPAELKYVSEIAPTEIDDDHSYYINELTIIDVYMTQTGGDSGNGKYYIASFEGKDRNTYMVSVYAKNNADIHDALEEYAKDSDSGYGDLVICGCFSAKKTTVDEDMDLYFSRSASSYADDFEEYLNIEATSLDLHLDYICGSPDNYEEEASNKDMLFVGIILAVLGGVLLYFGLRAKKKQQADDEARAQFNANQPTEDRYQGPEF